MKTRSFKLPLLIINVAFLATLCNCGPDDSDDRDRCVVKCDSIKTAPQELLDYFVFLKGSYWVYRLNGSDTLDTLTFAGFSEDYFELSAGCNYGISPCQKRYRIFFDHSNMQQFPISQGVSNERYWIEFNAASNQWSVSHSS